jgi:hypothetical protein
MRESTKASRDARGASLCPDRSGGFAEKLGGIDFQNCGKLFEHVDCGGMLLALKHANIVAIDVGTIRKLLLRQASGMSQPA